jgi:hypothetical protein
MKSLWSPLCAPGFVLSAFCSPPGSLLPNQKPQPSRTGPGARGHPAGSTPYLRVMAYAPGLAR